MAKKAEIIVLDGTLDITSTGNALHLCAGEPADRADVLVRSLGTVAMTPAPSADYTKGPGSPDGRTLTIAAKLGIPITANGGIDHVSIITATDLLITTTTPLKNVSNGDSVDTSAWTQRVAQAT